VLHVTHLGVYSLALIFLTTYLLRMRPRLNNGIGAEDVAETSETSARRAEVVKSENINRWRIRRDFLVSMFWWGTVIQTLWVLYSAGKLPKLLEIERFSRVLFFLGAEGILIYMRTIVRFAARKIVLASPTADTTAPLPVRLFSRYHLVLQVLHSHCCCTVVTLLSHCCHTVVTLLLHCCHAAVPLSLHSHFRQHVHFLLVPPCVVTFASDAAGEVAVQCLCGALVVLCLTMAATLLRVSFRLSEKGRAECTGMTP
jgi:hypothetical protein